jgi:hypothetical protein
MSDHAVITALLCAVVIEGAAIVALSGRRIQSVAAPVERGQARWRVGWSSDISDRPDTDWLPEAPTTAALHLWLMATDEAPSPYRPGVPRLSGEPDTVTPFQSGGGALLRAVQRNVREAVTA